ncbi:MAG TPA: alpha-1,2-fucosyltransferase [Anaerolineaceae bacterium]|nr:alpha-1,2-fucosyltransferase [Anaerolineaceae bacterium]
MIIVKIIGGLGNQMFQYAVGRSIACKHNTDLKLDISSFDGYRLRSYRLSCFNIVQDFATKDEIKNLKADNSRSLWHLIEKIRQKTLPRYKRGFIKEHNSDFDPDVLKTTGNTYLEGYWQSEKYFKDFSDVIRSDFTFKQKPDAINESALSQIRDTNSVSLHIRRGDYVSNPKTLAIHGVLGIDYYVTALTLIEEKLNDPEIFVFSDDMQWARNNLKTDLPLHFISHNTADKDYEDLRLMCNCKHHIIANSSFSWWGAWLGGNAGQLVIAPKKWYNTKSYSYADRFPSSWLVV